MNNIVTYIFQSIKRNLKNPKLYLFIFILFLVILLVFPYVDANFFYYDRLQKRLDILKKCLEIDDQKLAQAQLLKQEYDSILSAIEQQRNLLILSNKNSLPGTHNLLKFISGGALLWLLAVFSPFMKVHKTKKDSLIAFFLLLFLGAILGLIGYWIPNFSNPWFNYLTMPLLQIVLLIFAAVNTNTNHNRI